MNLGLSLKIQLLIFEYKERFPILSSIEISNMFDLNIVNVERLFQKGEIIVPSKMNNKKNFIS
jgi:hypothetical protein